MWPQLYDWMKAGSVILIYAIAIVVWLVKTNDLPHIYERLGRLEGRTEKGKK